MKTKIKELQKRIEALNPVKMVTVPHYENGFYKPIKMELSEAKRLAVIEIEGKL